MSMTGILFKLDNFESDTEKIVNSLEEFVLEGGGGGK